MWQKNEINSKTRKYKTMRRMTRKGKIGQSKVGQGKGRQSEQRKDMARKSKGAVPYHRWQLEFRLTIMPEIHNSEGQREEEIKRASEICLI